MARWVFFGVIPLLLALSVFAADSLATIPKDTLPAKLSVDEIPLGLGPRPAPKGDWSPCSRSSTSGNTTTWSRPE